MKPTPIGGLAWLLLLGALPPCAPQGLSLLLERAGLVLEARISGQGERVAAEVRRVWKGPSALTRLELYLPDRISAHARPKPGAWHLLHLVPLALDRRVWAPLQAPLAVIPMEAPQGRALASLVSRLAAHRHDPPALSADLLQGLCSPWPAVVEAAAQDLLSRPELLGLAPSGTGTMLLGRLAQLPPASGAAASLVHLVGVAAPPGWTQALSGLAARAGSEALAPSIGAVLAAHLENQALPLLAWEGAQPPPPGLLLALGASQLPEALPLLRRELSRPGCEALVGTALALHRSRQSCELLAEALAACPPEETQRALLLAQALANAPLTHGRRLLAELTRSPRPFAHAETARQALAR